MYEAFNSLLEKHGKTATDVSRETGIPRSTFTDWKSGRAMPKADKLQKIAEYFQVPMEYLLTGEMPGNYYLNEETAEMAQAIFDNPNLRALFSAAKDATPTQMKLAEEMLIQFKRTNHDG